MYPDRTLLGFVRGILDVVSLAVAFWVTSVVLVPESEPLRRSQFILILVVLEAIWTIGAQAARLYQDFRSRDFIYEIIVLLKPGVALFIGTVIVLFFVKSTYLSRLFSVVFSASAVIIMAIEKYLSRKFLKSIRRRSRNSRSVLIVGAGKTGMQFAQTVLDNPQYGYRVLGFLDDSHKDWLNGSYLGSIADLESILKTRRVDDVLIALPNSAHRKIESVVNACKNSTVRVRVVPDMKGLGLGSYDLTTFGGLPIFSFRKNNLNEAHLRMFKRTFDILFSLLVLALVYWWLWPLVILLQKIMDPGPLYYKAKRWGREGREFTCYKFRSMLPNSQNVDLNGNHLHTTTEDPRVTKLGRFLRKLNLDELPQFINVLKGEMSVVGPRPHDAAENIVLREKIRDYMPRHLVKPGVTGWAQVNGLRGGTDDIELMKKRTIYDIWYIENWSMWLDLQIILKTIWLAIKGDPNAY